jgi:hypothetical protein
VVHVQLGGKRGPIVSLAMEHKVTGASEPVAGAGEGGRGRGFGGGFGGWTVFLHFWEQVTELLKDIGEN